MQKVKTYDEKQIKELAKDYKFLSLEDVNGNQKVNWNGYTTKMPEHLAKCLKRMSSEALQDGFYNFCFSNSLRMFKNPDKFLFVKGNPDKLELIPLSDNENKHTPQNRSDLITIEKALAYISEIADLKVRVQIAEAQVKTLTEENEVLNSELDEAEKGLSDASLKPASDTLGYLKEVAPTILGLADRYFEQQEKKLGLEELKIKYGKAETEKKETVKREISKIETGSPEQIALIKMLHANNDENKMNLELDKLEVFNPEAYNNLCTELNLNFEQ